MAKAKRRKFAQDKKSQGPATTPSRKAAKPGQAPPQRGGLGHGNGTSKTKNDLTPASAAAAAAVTTPTRKLQASQRPPIPFSPYDTILLVGEGDFSFSRALVEHHGCAFVTATCLDTEDELYEKYPQSQDIVEYLKSEDQKVIFGIDAGKLGKDGGGGKPLRDDVLGGDGRKGYKKIVFNFPHVGGKSKDINRQVRYNQELLVSFLRAALPLLSRTPSTSYSKDDDEDQAPPQILVTLFDQPPYTLWNIRDLARHVGLRPVRSFQFIADDYPGYKHARTIGNIHGKGNEEDVVKDGNDTAIGEGDPGEGEFSDTEAYGNKMEGAASIEGEEKKRAGKWRGEERKARTFVFELPLENADSGSREKSKKKRKAESDSSDDDG